ncbi:glycosyltransferase involved in cell wall biosynthesis [Saccharothrix tamanrassetensis]|uniref:Glycosyltransferase involved in cell wall biosynthesis n=1 Tax=Saccharothrix tamanrassetensis TaxID=1051531 RepID=A0A841CD13_9PSEU|nr:glycosyltransferase family 1 protein [Saccharothrix tamanrassetensis]MBB5955141.1 glycosyltransferase involved in cell wall biosynthesis [Saccharothrix tamanrassetensis]
MAKPLKVLIDGTPLLGHRTGIGRYTSALAEELASMTDVVDVRAVAFTLRGWRALRTVLPHEVVARGLPVSARLLRQFWLRVPFPPVEFLAGPTDVMHATNFVLPPTIRAGGVTTIHDLAFIDRPQDLPPSDRRLPELVRRSALKADIVCTPTQAVANVVVDRFEVDPDKIIVTPLGVDPAWFAARPPSDGLRARLGLPGEYLLFVGADGPRKGMRTLLDAHAANPALPPLVLAGPGRAGVDGRVLRTGYLNDVDLRSVVAGAATLVLPSRDEGFGLPVLEALACNVPVVCTDVPALREVAGGHAVHVPVGDAEALGQALQDAVDEPPTPADQAARRAHASEFTWRKTAERTVEAYRLAAAARR